MNYPLEVKCRGVESINGAPIDHPRDKRLSIVTPADEVSVEDRGALVKVSLDVKNKGPHSVIAESVTVSSTQYED